MNKKLIISLCLLTGVFVCGAAYMGTSDSGKLQKKLTEYRGKTTDDIQQTAETDTDDRQTIQELYHTMYRYMLAKDVTSLSGMLSDDFVLIHMTGLHQSKKEYLRCIRDGELNYFTEETDHVYIDLHGDKAVLTGQSRVNAAVFGGGRHTWPLQLVIDMKKQEGKWMMTSAQASTY